MIRLLARQATQEVDALKAGHRCVRPHGQSIDCEDTYLIAKLPIYVNLLLYARRWLLVAIYFRLR